MGYSTEMFLEISKLKLAVDRVLDVGAQDVTVVSENDLENVNRFIQKNNQKNTISHNQFPVMFEAKEIYERAGYQYTNIDVDERPSTVRVDLASFTIPKKRNYYPLVVNVGTTEHLSSPISTFALMHELCAKNGFIYNDVPLFGFGNHGLINPTPKFWHAFIWMNQYKPFITRIRSVDESKADKGNFYHEYLNYFERLADVTDITYIIRCVVQKTNDNIFVPPYDAVFPNSDNGKSLACLLAGSYFPFVSTGAYTKKEVIKGINNFLKLNQRSYRVTSYSELIDSAEYSEKNLNIYGRLYINKLYKKVKPILSGFSRG